MLKIGLAALLLTTSTGLVVAQSNARLGNAASDAGPQDCRSARICNRVIDLLDGEIVLDAATERTTWHSRPFNTAQYNRVGIRFATQDDSSPVICSLWWQFTRDDDFLPGPPSTILGFIGDDSRLEPQIRPLDFSEIFGLRARAVCSLISLPDFGGGEPPPPASAVISDVKVLLRVE